jgi:3-oxoacyl-[acyl-carrier-protein] synthase-3
MTGIVDFDVVFPRSRASVQEMHELSGLPIDDITRITVCDGFPQLGDDEEEWELALAAARQVLARTGTDPAAIRHVIYAGSGVWSQPCWSPAGRVAHELGIERAHCFEVVNMCNAATTGLQIARDKVAAKPDEYALLLLGDRLSRMVDYTDPDSKPLFNVGDAGAAVLVGARGFRFAHLASAARSGPGWSEYWAGEFRKDWPGEHRQGGIAFRRKGHREGLGDAYVDTYLSLVDDVLSELGKKVSDVGHLLINQTDLNIHRRLLAALGLPEEASVFNYDRLAHQGPADTLIAIQDLLAVDGLKPGELILLATSGMGFNWGITALEYRP